MTGRALRFLAALAVSLAVLPVTAPSVAPEGASPRPTTSSETDAGEPLVGPPPFVRLESRAPIDCADLVSLAELSTAMGVPESEIAPIDDQFLEIWTAADIQAGTLTCQWQGPSRGWTTGEQAHQISPAGVLISVLPDAGAEFHAYSAYINAPGWTDLDPPVSGDLLGADSWLYCRTYELERRCDAAFETDGYWVEFSFNGPVPAVSSNGSDPQPAVSFGAEIQRALYSAGDLRPPYTISSDRLGAWQSCSAIDADGVLRGIVGSPSLPPAPDYVGYESLPHEQLAVGLDLVDFEQCGWNTPSEYSDGSPPPAFADDQVREMSLSLLPGGEWAWPELQASTLATAERGDGVAEEVVLPGGIEAVVVCFGDFACQADALVDHSLVSISYSYSSWAEARVGNEVAVAQGVRFLPAVIEYLRAHDGQR